MSAQTGSAVLAGSIAHELNQPLMSTATNAQAAIKFLSAPVPDLDEARAALTDIGHSIRRVAGMVRHLLDKLKRHATEHVPLDVNAVTAYVIRIESAPCFDDSLNVITEFQTTENV